MDEANNEKPIKKTPIAAQYLNGQTPRERGEAKVKTVCEWIYRWGYSSPDLVRQVAGQAAQGYGKKLAEKGLLVETKTESGTPKYFYTLSQTGLNEAERMSLKLLHYKEIDPYKVNQKLIRHNLIAQQATINTLKRGAISDYMTERMYADENKAGEKIPDVVWILPGGEKIAIEVELTAKWARELDQFILAVIRGLQDVSGPARYNRFSIITDSPAIERRYREAMSPGASLRYWFKNKRNYWEEEKTVSIPSWLINKVDFFQI